MAELTWLVVEVRGDRRIVSATAPGAKGIRTKLFAVQIRTGGEWLRDGASTDDFDEARRALNGDSTALQG